jgi:hypothetical protein
MPCMVSDVRQRYQALMASGGRREVLVHLTAFDDGNAANAYFVHEHMAGRIITLVE